MNLSDWLLALVAPLVVRAVIALGFTAAIFTGVTAGVQQLLGTAQSSWSTLPTAVLQLASLCGIPESLGMVFGSQMSLFALQASLGFGKYVFKQ